jgi:hypothetical protein
MKTLVREDAVVAELAQLGVGYLSRQSASEPGQVQSPHILLADLVRQPSSRVRAAVISLLLAHPEYAEFMPAALRLLSGKNARVLKIFYTAAAQLQKQYAPALIPFLGVKWRGLPDLYSKELGLADTAPPEQLKKLAQAHTELTGTELNWAGTYENAARHLLRRWEMEKEWNQSHR